MSYYAENRERVLAVARARRIATGQPRTRLCPCGAPARSSRHRYCHPCAIAAKVRRHSADPRTTTEKGYGNAHMQARKRWATKVDRGECTCTYCGRPIIPGTPWDLSHPFDDKFMAPEPWHAHCNRSYASAVTKSRRRRQ